jgi:DNA-binding response OmpR family regulator
MPVKILLVDDNSDQQDSVDLILKSNGFLVVKAGDGENALSFLASEIFDLIVLDLMLHNECTPRILEFIRTNHAASKVVMVTRTPGAPQDLHRSVPGAMNDNAQSNLHSDLLTSIKHVLSEGSPSNTKLQIIKAGNLINSTPTGTLDMKASKLGLQQIALSGAHLQEYTVLIDLRDIKSVLSMPDIYEIASELVNYGDTFRRKTAVLIRADDDIDQALFFEDAAQNRGFEIKYFIGFEEAILWLSSISAPCVR